MKRVLLVVSGTLFGQGVQNLLRQDPCLEVLSCDADMSTVLEHIAALQPDAVLLERRKPAAGLGQTLHRLLRAARHLTVIEMDPNDDTARIYSCQQRVIRQVQDLVEAIDDPIDH